MMFNSCQFFENVEIWCCDDCLTGKDLIVAEYSPKNIYELKL